MPPDALIVQALKPPEAHSNHLMPQALFKPQDIKLDPIECEYNSLERRTCIMAAFSAAHSRIHFGKSLPNGVRVVAASHWTM